jgi:photosystem II stability/assembly factor-like uncharacterized protein
LRDCTNILRAARKDNAGSLTKIFVLGWLALALVLLSGCDHIFVKATLNQDDDTETWTYPPLALRGRWTARWNHYTVDGGGGQTALAVNPLSPNVVYATTDFGGIVKSVDYGDHWYNINNNIGSTRLANVTLDPLDPGVVYATASECRGCGHGELYRSLDSGVHWEFLTSAFGAEKWPSTRGIVIVPQDADGDSISDVLYVGAWAGNEGAETGGIWKSSDEGATWQPIGRVDGDGDILRRANVWVLRNEPSNPQVFYAGMWVYPGSDTPGGILKSTDGGLNWTDITHDIPVSNISDVAISPDGTTLYVATNSFYETEPGAGIYKSTNGGDTWMPVNRGLEKTSLKFVTLLMDKDDPNVLYTGPFRGDAQAIYKTIDGGQHWYRTTYDQTGWWVESFDNTWAMTEGADSKLYVATWNGIYRSDDDGERWLARPRGLGNVIVYDLALDPQNPSTIYLGLGDIGPWKSMDGGRTWARINDGYYEPYGRGSGGVAAFAISPSDPQIIYSAVRGSSGSTLMGVNKTVNGGQRWKAINNGLPGPDPAWVATDVVVHPLTPDITYLGIQLGDSGDVYKTTDGGSNWIGLSHGFDEKDLPRVESLAISASAPDVVLVGTREPGRLYRTSDGGDSWALISPPPDLMDPNTIIYDIDVHPLYPEQIIIGVNTQGAYKTSDGGRTWTHVLDSAFFRSHVGEIALNPERSVQATITTVKFDPDNPQIIYAGHYNRGMAGLGVVKSTDGGATWSLFDDSGLQYRNILVMDIHPRTKELFVGGFDGIYVYTDRVFFAR